MPSNPIKRRGLMFVLSSPSGAGKTSIARAILTNDADLKISISVTTRPKRPAEKDGVDYHFVDVKRFEEMRQEGIFLEYATVFGHSYGTPKEPVLKALEDGFDVLFDIDWQGTQQIAQHAVNDLVRVFILPPTYRALEQRLKKRAQDNDETIHERMKSAFSEMSHWAEYEYVLINENFEHSVDLVRGILNSERHKRRRQVGLADFVKGMMLG